MKKKVLRRGFTVKEFLAVAALFGFMAAVLWPTDLGTGRRYNDKATCRNNLKQIALGVIQYRNDWDERYPVIVGDDKSSHGWADALLPYVKNPLVYQCPSDTNAASASPSQNGFTDYWYNANLTYRFQRDGRTIVRPHEVHATPGIWSEQTILLGDGGNTDGIGGHDATYNQCGDGTSLHRKDQICKPSKSRTAIYPAAQIHLGGANLAFADGHVQWISADTPTSSAQIRSNTATRSDIGHQYTFSLLSNRE